MLKSLELENFTVFEQAKFEFCDGLNVVIGENGTGKTQLLKLGYAAMNALYHQFTSPVSVILGAESSLGNDLLDVFQIEELRKLVGSQINAPCEVSVSFFNTQNQLQFAFVEYPNLVEIKNVPKPLSLAKPIFIPTREILSIFEGFAAALRNRELAFDSTFLDLADALALTHLKGEKLEQVKPFIAALEQHMNGKVILERGRFYLEQNKRRLEMPLVAEGIRKLAMLAHLLANGSIQKGSSVFWDEPESNLNPKLIRSLAEVLVGLAGFGVQIFIATHSLFLLRELEIQLAVQKEVPRRFFALKPEKTGVSVSQGNEFSEIDPIVVLDVELEQSDRYLELV